MAILNTRELRQRGAAAAQAHRSQTAKLVLLYCGVGALISLGSNAITLYLDSHISSTGGLSGLGLRSVLQTIQEALGYINLFYGPFWSAGFLYAMLGLVRGEEPRCGDLLEGFRRFGRVLMALLYQTALCFALAMGAMVLAFLVFTFSPWGTAVSAMLEPVLPELIAADGTINMAAFPAEAMRLGVYPLVALGVGLYLLGYAFFQYCFRMASYLMMERQIGGVAALFLSARLMRGHKRQMLKLDLSFWWYYALNTLIAVVCYLDVILSLLGVSVPLGAEGMFFLTLGAYCVLNTALCLWKKREVDAAYILAFEAIAYPEPVEAE